jgi:hypothetical protein
VGPSSAADRSPEAPLDLVRGHVCDVAQATDQKAPDVRAHSNRQTVKLRQNLQARRLIQPSYRGRGDVFINRTH